MFSQSRSYIKDAVKAGELNGSAVEQATKKLTVASILLSGLEHGGAKNPEWFIDFLFASLRESDRMVPTPPARSLVELHGQWVREEIISGVVRNALISLKGAQTSPQLSDSLVEAIEKDSPYRAELMEFALTQPLSLLEEHQTLFDIPAV